MSLMKGAIGLGVMMSVALTMVIPWGYWVGPAWLAVLGLLGLLGRLLPGLLHPYALGRRGVTLLILLLLGLVIPLGMSYLHGELLSFTLWARSLAFLLAALSLMALHTWMPRLDWFWGGLGIGGALAGGWALWQWLEGTSRANGHDPLHAILFGNLGLLTGALCLAGLGWAWQRPWRGPWVLLLATGAAGGLMASMLSGTRGGWLSLPLMLLVFQQGLLRWLPRRTQLAVWLIVAAIAVTAYALPQTGVQQRVQLAIDEIQHYLDNEPSKTRSLVLRLEMWRGATEVIAERPWLGHGEDGYHRAMVEQVEELDLVSEAAQLPHAHNDVLDAWAKLGAPALSLVLALYLVPVWLFRRGLGHPDNVHRALATAGLLVPVTFIDFGLSYSFLSYPVGVLVYGGWLAMIWAFYRHTRVGHQPGKYMPKMT